MYEDEIREGMERAASAYMENHPISFGRDLIEKITNHAGREMAMRFDLWLEDNKEELLERLARILAEAAGH